MSTYCYRCPGCKTTSTIDKPMAASNRPEQCSCGEWLERDYQAEQCSGHGDYADPIISESMAFDSADANEHRRQFPNVGLAIEGRSAYPILRSLKQKKEYLKKRGFVDVKSFD